MDSTEQSSCLGSGPGMDTMQGEPRARPRRGLGTAWQAPHPELDMDLGSGPRLAFLECRAGGMVLAW